MERSVARGMSRIIEPIPVYVVTGFLSTGKTCVINHILSFRSSRVGRVAMEDGRTKADTPVCMLPMLTTTNIEEVAQSLLIAVQGKDVQEVWLEYNGMLSFTLLERLFCDPCLVNIFQIKRVYFVTTTNYCLHLLGKTGSAVESQLANADCILWWDKLEETQVTSKTDDETVISRLQQLCPHTPCIRVSSLVDRRSINKILKDHQHITGRTIALGVGMAVCYIGISVSSIPLLENVKYAMALWMATVIQALSFLLLGIICSSFLQTWIPTSFFTKRLQGNLVTSMGWALVGGFLFPVCDCAAIPVFRSLLVRGVPLPAALLFMLASPIINPIVILSTWYAFFGMPQVVIARLVLGVIIAVLVSLSFLHYRGLDSIVGRGQGLLSLEDRLESLEKSNKVFYFLENARKDFFRMAPFIIIASLVVSFFQVYIGNFLKYYSLTGNLAMTIELMIALAFVLSICSTADAMIARNMSSNIPLPGILAFLVFGPMMDVKNFFVLTSLFPKAFVYRLLISLLLACFVFAFAFAVITGSVVL